MGWSSPKQVSERACNLFGRNGFFAKLRKHIGDQPYQRLSLAHKVRNHIAHSGTIIGTRNALKAILAALLEPTELLQGLEREGDLTARLALMEEQKMMPLSDVWNYYCESAGVPGGSAWL